MTTTTVMDFEVVVIGAGLAGLRAALAAAEAGCRTGIVCKSYLAAETASGMAGGGFIYPSKDLPPEDYLEEVVRTGRGFNDMRLLESLARYGEADFHDAVRRFGWSYVVRDRYQSTLTGGLVPGYRTTLQVARAAVAAGAMPVENHTVVKLLVDDGRCLGCVCLNERGELCYLKAGAVVLATGGFAGLFALNDNPPRSTGDGHVLALEAGCRLRDMEFVQFYPLGLDDKRLPHYMMGLPFPQGTRLLDENGEDVLARHFPAGTTLYEAAKEYRDRLSIVILKEKEQGHRPLVDFSQTDRGEWDRFSITRLLPRWGRDPLAAPVPVSPIAHFTMGGVVVGPDLQTDVPGLFAAGEVAGGVHGANRYAANALLACLVHGRLAGEAAARAAVEARAGALACASLPAREDILAESFCAYLCGGSPAIDGGAEASEEVRRLRGQLGQLCGRYLNPLRSENMLRQGLAALSQLEARVRPMRAGGACAREVVELRAGVRVARWAMQAALLRQESRGAHYRDDFPQTDEITWRRPIVVEPTADGEGEAR